jgi:sugar O-acyltransferase (sialic acid O-acetyltransferase NeuD family)
VKKETPKKIVLFGAGQGADTARRYFESDTPHRIVGHIVDRAFLPAGRGTTALPTAAVEDAIATFPPESVLAFVALGAEDMNSLRVEKYALLKRLGYRFATYVHSSNLVADRCQIGENCLILENQSINFDTVIGNNVVIWSGCQIGDRSRIGDHVFMASHVVVNGDVVVGERCFLGSNANISDGAKLGARSFIGGNALISGDTREDSVHIVEATPAAGIDSRRFMRLLDARRRVPEKQ